MFEDSLCREWEKKETKHSHKEKPLANHIEEVKRTVSRFLDFYGDFPEVSREIANYLSEYHDYGKLCKSWTLDQERNPPHSPMSVQWLWDNNKFLETDKRLTLFLWYLILKHHSKLTDVSSVRKFKPLVEDVRLRLNTIDAKTKVDLVDVFGLFKIADILSAKGKPFDPDSPEVTEDVVKKIIDGNLDYRWEQQLELQKLRDIGILRAPTGWGKTTASLLFFLKKPVKKIFFLLPTITAINKFHSKFSKGLCEKVTKYFYFYDAELSEERFSEEGDKLNEMFFSENFMSPFVITTIDQFLLAFLQYGKYHTKRVMFRDAGLVIDEVHLLNPLMLNLTKYFLDRFAVLYRLKALFMSATLPDALSQYLMKELNLPKQSFLDYAGEYHQRRRVMLSYINCKHLDEDVNFPVQCLKDGKKVLVIVNTVDKAIELAKLLGEYLPRKDVTLIHSRFMYRDRKNKEKEIDLKRESPHILVSTQICEVSLDISYDVLFTELSPLPSMVQRFGRANRYGSWVNATNTYVYEPRIENEFRYPYEPAEINMARKVVGEVEGEKLRSEGHLLDLINQQYSFDYLEREVQKAMNKVDLKAFDEIFGFFSLDVAEEKLMNILNYRDSFSVLIVPHPNCILKRSLGEQLDEIISRPLMKMDFAQRRQTIAEIKNMALPVPIWWLKKETFSEDTPLPVVQFKNKRYDQYYGLIGDEVP